MKILITVERLNKNDDHFTFFLDWLEEFAKYYSEVHVIGLSVGNYLLPENVKVYSLGKENGRSRIKYIIRFYKYIFKLRKNYDHVFVFMNPEYVNLGGIFWRLWGKKVGLWYVHRQVNLKLRMATILANVVFTAATESFRIKTSKVNIVGHGINTRKFYFSTKSFSESGVLKILTVSRIAPIKHLETMIKAMPHIEETLGRKVELIIISKIPEIGESNFPYYESLRKIVKDLALEEKVKFIGAVKGEKIPKYYHEADIVLNLTPTGGIDKTVLESLSTGTPTLASNEALRKVFTPFDDLLLTSLSDEKNLAQSIVNIVRNEPSGLREKLRENIEENFAYEKLVKKIVNIYGTSN